MSAKSPHPESGHSCRHPACCPTEAGLRAAAQPGGEGPPGQSAAADRTPMGSLKRGLLFFLAFFGIYASSSVCPFCGAPGCPVGLSGAAVVGGVFAALWQYGKLWFGGVVRFIKRLLP